MSAIQIKDVPEDLHDALRARATEHGTTIGAYLLELIRLDLQRNRTAAWFDELRRRPPMAVASTADAGASEGAGLVRAGRDERDDHLAALIERPGQGRVLVVDGRTAPPSIP